jgi:capsular polysaccharide export protein
LYGLDSFVGQEISCDASSCAKGKQAVWLGWGIKRSSLSARLLARICGGTSVFLEDGFLRSYFSGKKSLTLSLVFDELGIYYDCNQTSVLEQLLNGDKDLLSDCESFLTQARTEILTNGLSKYNHAPNLAKKLLSNSHSLTECQPDIRFKTNDSYLSGDRKKILVVDQTFGDMSVQYGGATRQIFTEMLSAALAENPEATIYVKTHPEVSSGKKSGYLTSVKNSDRVVVLRDAVNPIDLIKQMDKVYVVTSGMGFEALMVDKLVVCFGVPWYAGWGLTDDRVVDSPAWTRRTRKRTVDELFAAAYIHYTRYLNPVTHQRGQITDVIHWLIHQKKMANQVHGSRRKNRVIGFGFRQWKAANLKPIFGLHQELVHFAKDISHLDRYQLSEGESVLYWGARPPSELVDFVSDRKSRLLHVEDGFIRSVGLGSDLIRPLSLVMDQKGLYFDATRPSDLEIMLNGQEFTEDDLSRAAWVKQYIIDHEITKYNLEPRQVIDWRPLAKRCSIILVPGQVEDDASIRLGCTTIQTNLDLLKAVRAEHPKAFIVYKPHPDVLSGNRKGRIALKEIAPWVNHIETEVSIISCINACDEVHTMTSLSGFDALLRGKKVVTYGQPFYAGWGLTEDRAESPTAFKRRQRKLTLEQLIAGALLHYPIYWDWDLKGYTTCEAVLHRIVEQRTQLEQAGKLDQLRIGYVRRQLRKANVVLKSILVS